jgi:hypothetical protein
MDGKYIGERFLLTFFLQTDTYSFQSESLLLQSHGNQPPHGRSMLHLRDPPVKHPAPLRREDRKAQSPRPPSRMLQSSHMRNVYICSSRSPRA